MADTLARIAGLFASVPVATTVRSERSNVYSEDVIRARRFELVDDAENVRAALTAVPGGAGGELIGLHIANNEGTSIAFIGVDPELNAPFLTLQDGAGSRAALFASVTSEGYPAVILRDGDGDEQIITVDLLRKLRG